MTSFFLQKDNIFALPILHYKMEMSALVHLAFQELQPDCVAVELPETLQEAFLRTAERLPDISLVMAGKSKPLYFMCEPCDPCFEGLRSALEASCPAFCIDLDIDHYPDLFEPFPDVYAIQRIGLEDYYKAYQKLILNHHPVITEWDRQREHFMAKKLKELSLRYDKILFISGMAHTARVLEQLDLSHFSLHSPTQRDNIELYTLTEQSSREVMAECGWFTVQYETWRTKHQEPFTQKIPDRQQLLYNLYKQAAKNYTIEQECDFPPYHMRNLMKFVRNYALIQQRLMPDLFQLLSAAKGCVDHNFAYEVWALATDYPYRKNIDNLPELDLSVEDVWGMSKQIFFHLKEKKRQQLQYRQKKREKGPFLFKPPSPFSICSYPPEDYIVENYGNFLQKKGTLLFTEEAAHTIPFTTSLEDGIDTRETIRHWYERKLYVKVRGRPPGGAGSVVMIFDSDSPDKLKENQEKFPWCTTWLGEHEQESDMAFYATDLKQKVVGPGISRCLYGGFMMSYPPRRMFNIWADPHYHLCRTKPEVLLMAAIDYAIKPLIVYVAEKPPAAFLKGFARRFDKKVVYIPIGQLSPVILKKIQQFHVLDGHDKREIADEYI